MLTFQVSIMPELSKEKAFNWVSENESRIAQISDKIWEYAELGLQEHKSSSLLADELEKAGFKVQRGIAGMPTAFMASYGSGKPVIAILGEYDALPGLSQKPMPKKEPLVSGAPGHGCGHNIYGASGMAAVIAVKNALEASGAEGTVKFFGCPAEENFSGKAYMVRDGFFDDVDASVSHHPSTMNGANLKSFLAINSAKFAFFGESSHAAGAPEAGKSALDAVELMNVGVNFLREHVIQEARIHYVIENGGGQPNVVPAYARSWYYVRAPEREQVEAIYKRVLDIAKGAALMTGTSHEVRFIKGLHNVIPNRTLAELVVRNMKEIGAPSYTDAERAFVQEMVKTIPPQQKLEQLRKSKRPGWEKLMNVDMDGSVPDPWGEGEIGFGSTDVAEISWKTPAIELGTATCALGTPSHSWQFTVFSGTSIGHKALLFASKTMAACAIDLLSNQELLSRAHKELESRLMGRVYKSALATDAKPPLDAWEK